MRTLILAATMLAMSGGLALAQTTTESTTSETTAAPPAPVSPPPGVLSTEKETHAVNAYGDRYDKKSTTYNGPEGTVHQSETRSVTAPPPPPPTTTTTTTQQTTEDPR